MPFPPGGYLGQVSHKKSKKPIGPVQNWWVDKGQIPFIHLTQLCLVTISKYIAQLSRSFLHVVHASECL